MKNIITIVACSILLESISAGNITNSDYDFFENQIPVAVSSQSQLSDSEQTMKALPEIDRIEELEQLPLPGIEMIDPVLAAVGGYLWETDYPYAPYRSEIYYNIFNRVINNCYAAFPGKYTKDDSTIILTPNEIEEISSSTFHGRPDIVNCDPVPAEYTNLLDYDSESNTFQAEYMEPEHYSAELTSIKKHIDYNVYDVVATLKKDNVEVATIGFTLSWETSFNRNDSRNTYYSIVNAFLLTAARTADQDHSASDSDVINEDPDNITDFVAGLYQKSLNRTASEEEINYYANDLADHKLTGADIGKNFISSPEFTNRNLNNADYIEVLYQTFMNRSSDADGKTYWKNMLNNGVSRLSVLRGFVESPEYDNVCSSLGITRGSITLTELTDQNPDLTMFVHRLYKKTLDREPDTAGLNYYVAEIIAKRITPVQAAQNFIHSSEFKNRNLSDTDYMLTLYQGFFGRESDPEGLHYYLNLLNAGTEREQLVINFSNSPEFNHIVMSLGL